MRQFYGRLEKCVLSAGKTHVHKIPRFFWGVFWVFFSGGGGSADFIFMGARIFLNYFMRVMILKRMVHDISLGPGVAQYRAQGDVKQVTQQLPMRAKGSSFPFAFNSLLSSLARNAL